jgi:hypothetical protein
MTYKKIRITKVMIIQQSKRDLRVKENEGAEISFNEPTDGPHPVPRIHRGVRVCEDVSGRTRQSVLSAKLGGTNLIPTMKLGACVNVNIVKSSSYPNMAHQLTQIVGQVDMIPVFCQFFLENYK